MVWGHSNEFKVLICLDLDLYICTYLCWPNYIYCTYRLSTKIKKHSVHMPNAACILIITWTFHAHKRIDNLTVYCTGQWGLLLKAGMLDPQDILPFSWSDILFCNCVKTMGGWMITLIFTTGFLWRLPEIDRTCSRHCCAFQILSFQTSEKSDSGNKKE